MTSTPILSDGLAQLLDTTTAYLERLQSMIDEIGPQGDRLIVFSIDLDDFSRINNAIGYTAGDALLADIAQRIRSIFPATDTVARLGVDRFAVACRHAQDREYTCLLAEKVMADVFEPFRISGHDLFCTASIGMSQHPDDGVDPETLLRKADLAMTRVKQGAGNGWRFFSGDTNALDPLCIADDLQGALERGEFMVHYQPVYELSSGEVVSVEPLIRWKHPRLGTLQPIQFMRVAQELNLWLEIGHWVMLTACEQAKRWSQDSSPVVPISINLAASELDDPYLLERIQGALREFNLDTELLRIEFRESDLAKNPASTIKTLRELRNSGVRVVLDDFGTEDSSLRFLRNLCVDAVKIDISLIRGTPVKEADTVFTKAIIDIAKVLNLTVIAEGVETDEQLRYLERVGCAEAQGNLLCAPRGPEAVEDVLQRRIVSPAVDMDVSRRSPGK